MSAIARQLGAEPLGAGRWRIELGFVDRRPPGVTLPRPHPGDVTVRRGRAEIESLVVPLPTAPRRFNVVVAVAEPSVSGTPSRLEVGGAGWTAEIELPEAPGAAITVASRPAAIDYTARDYEAMRTMLLEVVDARTGGGLSDHPVAQTAALVEELAYLGDALSYSQDAVATEAYLASARRRISVTRHAELLDYQVGSAVSARVWVRFTVSEPVTLPAGTQLLTGGGGLAPLVAPEAVPAALAAGAQMFETLAPATLGPDQPPHQLAPVRHAAARLAPGAVSATVLSTGDVLREGDLVVIEPVDRWATPAGQVVRLTRVTRDGAETEVEWSHADALGTDEALTQTAVQLRRGNLVPAEHGQSHDWMPLPTPSGGLRYWPELPLSRPAFTAGPPAGGAALPQPAAAAEILWPPTAQVMPAVQVRSGPPGHQRAWAARRSLLESGPFDAAFVVEVEEDGSARLRFGDGTNGMRPPVGGSFEVWMRTGGGSGGNVGVGAIAHLVGGGELTGIAVRNPVAATGGADPEPLAAVRVHAPTAFRITNRAIRAEDYTAAALAVAGVADATATIVPGGTGPVARVRVFSGDWTSPADAILAPVRAALDRLRPAGVAVDVAPAVALPVTIALDVTIDAAWTPAAMAATIEQTLGDALAGTVRFGFGTSLHRSQVIALLTPLPGIVDVTLTRFRFTGDVPGASAREELSPPWGRIIRLDDDPASPQHGSVSFRLRTVNG
jgi:hypothetical protein